MLCDKCKKNQAAVHFEQLNNGETSKMYLCYKCSLDFQTPMFFNNILNGLMYNLKIPTEEISSIICATCGLKLSEFRKIGKLGCANCYIDFKTELNSLLQNIQWNVEHKGKYPATSADALLRKKAINKLRTQLNAAITLEEYEQAAKLRDEIRDIEGGSTNEMV